jgi:trehalose-6-phosphate synthase
MLACDLVGFHVEAYARNFLDCVERALGVDVSRQSWSVEFQGRFGSATWSPIRYRYQLLGRQQLAALYRDADVMLATPLRDGMNLVAEEFVACQVGDPGVLILSRLAGAAETMHEALLVPNPDYSRTCG